MSLSLKFIQAIKRASKTPTPSPPASVKAEVPSNNGNHPDRRSESEKKEK